MRKHLKHLCDFNYLKRVYVSLLDFLHYIVVEFDAFLYYRLMLIADLYEDGFVVVGIQYDSAMILPIA